jgi:hypothetical protein
MLNFVKFGQLGDTLNTFTVIAQKACDLISLLSSFKKEKSTKMEAV